MTIHTLYTGGGVSLSPIHTEGRRVSEYVRLVAEDGMGITDGTTVTICIDTKTPETWTDCELPPEPTPEEEATSEDYEEALGRFGV